MRKTIFAGLLVPEPGESINEDNGSFFTDRDTIDHLLEVGAKTHRHNGLNGLATPITAPGASILASGGTIPAGESITLGYTLEDATRGETMLSEVAVVSTPPPIQAPQAAPSGSFASDHGSLLVNTYFYALTYTDGEGGETPLGPARQVERPPGFASGHIEVSNLTFGLEAAGASGWRLYRATGGASYNLLAAGGLGEDTFDDDGSKSLDCSAHPPAGELNTTSGINQLRVELPSELPEEVAFINLYATVSGDFTGGSFLTRVPVASAGGVMVFSSLELGTDSPPDVNLSIGGAHKIDPDTEILDWHWKRPVATFAELPGEAEEGDVRIVLDEDAAYVWSGTEWVPIGSGEGGGGGFKTTGPGGEDVVGVTFFEEEEGYEGAEPVDLAAPHKPLTEAVNGESKKKLEVKEFGVLIAGPAKGGEFLYNATDAKSVGDNAIRAIFKTGSDLSIFAQVHLNAKMRFSPNQKVLHALVTNIEGSQQLQILSTENKTSQTTELGNALEPNSEYRFYVEIRGHKVIARIFEYSGEHGEGEEIGKVEVTLSEEEFALYCENEMGCGFALFDFEPGEWEFAEFVKGREAIENALLEVEGVKQIDFDQPFNLIETEAHRVKVELLDGMGYVFADEDLTKERPNFSCVTWMTREGPGIPENMEENDVLIDTTIGVTTVKVLIGGELK